MSKEFFVYIVTNKRNGTLYVGMTSDITRRMDEHGSGEVPGFTRSHGLKHLAWFEHHATFESAMRREKRLKRWPRVWKLGLIEQLNPNWADLSHALSGQRIDGCPPIPDDLARHLPNGS